MTDYVLKQIYLEGLNRYYLLLPKLNDVQLRLIAKRLEASGFTVEIKGRTRAKSGERMILVDRAGFAYSNMDFVDQLAPVIPSLLNVTKSKVVDNPYFVIKRARGGSHIQFFPRLESLQIWSELRKVGSSGLTPDEATIVSSLLQECGGKVRAITDYPCEDSKTLQLDRRMYYESRIEVGDYVSNLRSLGTKNRRNTYLPRSSILEVEDFKLPSRSRMAEIVNSLGEWCYLLL